MLRFFYFGCFMIAALSPDHKIWAEINQLGWIERVKIVSEGIELDAKLDTGADHCSLHARNLKFFEKNGEQYVRFRVRNRKGEQAVIEQPVVREASIKRIAGSSHTRPVVRMTLCIGDSYREVDVNLADRTDFSYPMLIGRSFLAGNSLVDSSRTYTRAPECDLPSSEQK